MKKNVKIIITILLIIISFVLFLFCKNAKNLNANKVIETEKEILEIEKIYNLNDKYYYSQLNEQERKYYRVIYQGIYNMEESFLIDSDNVEILNSISHDILKDNPDMFWYEGTSDVTGSTTNSYSIISPKYIYTKEEKEIKQKEIDEYIEKCFKNLNKEATDYEKIEHVFKYIIKNTEYSEIAENGQNICSVFINKKSLCNGYAKATKYLLNKLGIESIYVLGEADGGSHAWNIVKCENKYYHLDTAWGDAMYDVGIDLSAFDVTDYEYLCCNDNEIFKTHKLNEYSRVPRCNDTEWSYYTVNNSLYSKYNEKQIKENLINEIKNKKTQSVLKFSNNESYENSKEPFVSSLIYKIMDEANLEVDNKIQQFFYQYDDEYNKIVIFWKYE